MITTNAFSSKKRGYYLYLACLTLFFVANTFPGQATPSSDARPGEYIVVFNDGVADVGNATSDLARAYGLDVHAEYEHALKGFAATVPEARLAQLMQDNRVAYVSEDREVSAFRGTTTPPPQPVESVPTGIARIGTSASTGNGIAVAIIDTGVDLTHPDLAANIVANKSCVIGKKNGNDDNGHGTHVAGTIAALNNDIGVIGVAPEAKLVAVKVLNSQGSGTWSSIICGLDWVAANASLYNIKVANMSLGGGGSSDNACGSLNNDALHQAICRVRDAGVTLVVAAGNESANASQSVPSAYNDAVITVSALADSNGTAGGGGSATSYGADDTFATFSNYGSVVDIGAPGVSILSTWKGGAYNTISGTSMATPHVAGAAAAYLQTHPSATWTQVRDALRSAGEVLGSGHTDPSGRHPEPVLQKNF
jgi:subtilisin